MFRVVFFSDELSKVLVGSSGDTFNISSLDWSGKLVDRFDDS